MKFFLEGKRVGLRILSENDINGNYKYWLNDGVVCQYNSHHRFPVSIEDLQSYVRNAAQEITSLVLAIVFKDNCEHIGNVSLQNIDYLNRTAEFAMLLGEKKYWGKGIAKEAGGIIINHGFVELGLNRIYMGASKENIGAQKLALGLGFQQEGLRREGIYKNGKYNDVLEYGILRCEWNEGK